MTGKVLIFFLDTILTFFRVFLFYKKYVEVPESKILIDSNKVTLFNQGFDCVSKLNVLNKNLQMVRRKRVEK